MWTLVTSTDLHATFALVSVVFFRGNRSNYAMWVVIIVKTLGPRLRQLPCMEPLALPAIVFKTISCGWGVIKEKASRW